MVELPAISLDFVSSLWIFSDDLELIQQDKNSPESKTTILRKF